MPFVQQITWDDVPHLSEAQKQKLMSAIPPHQRDARTRGDPVLGAGVIYPVPWSEVSVAPFAIPPYWKRGYGLDFGWNRTAAIWAAQNPADSVIYAYAEHYRGQAEPVIHSEAIKARGGWIKGAADPAGHGASQIDGRKLIDLYRANGLKLVEAENAVEAGLYQVWTLLSTGQLKLFTTLQKTSAEYRIYRRDERGRIIKENDHLMDALRYLIMTWAKIATVQAPPTVIGRTMIGDREAGY